MKTGSCSFKEDDSLLISSISGTLGHFAAGDITRGEFEQILRREIGASETATDCKSVIMPKELDLHPKFPPACWN